MSSNRGLFPWPRSCLWRACARFHISAHLWWSSARPGCGCSPSGRCVPCSPSPHPPTCVSCWSNGSSGRGTSSRCGRNPLCLGGCSKTQRLAIKSFPRGQMWHYTHFCLSCLKCSSFDTSVHPVPPSLSVIFLLIWILIHSREKLALRQPSPVKGCFNLFKRQRSLGIPSSAQRPLGN